MPKIPYNKRKDGRYYKQIIIGVDENGKRKVKTLYDRDWRALDKKVREFQVNLDAGKYVEKDITFGECVQLWWKTKIDITEGTARTYNSNLKNVQHLYHLKMKDIKPHHIQLVYTSLYEKDARQLIRSLPALLKRIFDFAVKNNFVTYNIVERVDVPRLPIKKRRSLSEDEKVAISEAFSIFTPFEQAFVGLLLYTGMRRGEILALKITDINFEEHYIDVQRTITIDKKYNPIEKDTTKTPAGMRKVPLMPQLSTILKEYIENGNCYNQYLFLTRKHNFIDSGTMRYRWEHILDKINQFMPEGKTTDISCHYFRHNFATELVYSNLPLKTIQFIMGHERINTTMDIYADIKFDVYDSINKLNQNTSFKLAL